MDQQLSRLPLLPFLLASRLATSAFFVLYMLMWRSYYNLGYLLLTDDPRILAAFAVSTALLVAVGAYSTVIGSCWCWLCWWGPKA